MKFIRYSRELREYKRIRITKTLLTKLIDESEEILGNCKRGQYWHSYGTGWVDALKLLRGDYDPTIYMRGGKPIRKVHHLLRKHLK